MRRVLVFLAVAVVLLVGALALAIANLDSFVDANRQSIEEGVEHAIGRPVSFGTVGISWAGGLGVRVDDLRVGEDAAFAKNTSDFLTADAVDVHVNLWAALFGRIEVTRVVLRAPRITVIQTAQGLSTDSLLDAVGGGTPASDAGSAGPGNLQVSLVDVRDGELTYIDRTAAPPAEFVVKALDVRIPSYRAGLPVDLEVSAAVAGAEQRNLSLSGSVGPLGSGSPPVDLTLALDPLEIGDLLRLSLVPSALGGSGVVSLRSTAKGTLDALGFTAKVDARKAALRYGGAFDKPAGVAFTFDGEGKRAGDTLSLGSLKLVVGDAVLRGTASVATGEATRLQFAVKSDRLAPGAFGIGEPGDQLDGVEADGELTLPASGPQGTFALRSSKGSFARAPYQDLRVQAKVAGDRVTLERATAKAFAGKLVATGRYNLARSAFQGSAELDGMSVSPLVATRSASGAQLISGNLTGKLDVDGTGSGWAEIAPALTGSGELRIADGVLGKFNPAGKLFAALGALPSVSGGGFARFVASHPRVFGGEETSFEAMTGRLQIQSGWVQLRDLVLRTPDYVLRGSGRVSLAGVLDVKTQMVLSAELSKELVAAQPVFRYLRDKAGSVEIPVALQGSVSKVAVVPDVSHIASLAGRELLTDALVGALGGKSKKEDTPSEEPAAPIKPKDVGRELLRQGLEGLFGGGQR